MSDIVDKIIENFAEQHQLYSQMCELARQQLDILEGQPAPSESERIQELLSQRQEILASIMLLNDDNKQYQVQAIEQTGIKHFVLSELKDCIEHEQFARLQSRIADLGALLESINSIDKQNQRVMETGIPSGKKATSIQAQKAYRSAMESNKKSQ